MRTYTLAEANAQVPALKELFTRVFTLRSQLRALYQKLEAQRFAPIGEEFEPAIPGAPVEVVRDRTLFKGMAEVLRADINSVLALGCVIKDIDVGLVDWLARSGREEVLLCWRFGEREVGFFHGLETGFAGRRPVSELLPAEAEHTLH
jgi:hypothetical protein